MSKTALRVCSASVVLAFAVVILGAFTRLVDAGLGCPDWPTCYGHLWVPNTEAEVLAANEKFADTPVEHDKTWPEQAHRLIASALGLLILALFFLCYRERDRSQRWVGVIVLLSALVAGTVARIFVGDAMDLYLWLLLAGYFLHLAWLSSRTAQGAVPFRLPSLIAGLVILQGLFGMWTVTLYLWPQVVTAHLLGGFATLSLLWLLLQRLAHWRWRAAADTTLNLMRLRPLATIAMVVVIVQIALGGWVSSNYAALACPDFPLCQNQLLPAANYAAGFNFLQDLGPNYLGGLLDNQARVAIHFSHRLGALVVVAVIAVLAYELWRSRYPRAQHLALVLLAVLATQLTLGVLNIVLALPLYVAVAHNAVGALLLITVTTINHRIRTVETL